MAVGGLSDCTLAAIQAALLMVAARSFWLFLVALLDPTFLADRPRNRLVLASGRDGPTGFS